MTDTLTRRQRSERMSRVRGKNTGPELLVRKVVYAMRGFGDCEVSGTDSLTPFRPPLAAVAPLFRCLNRRGPGPPDRSTPALLCVNIKSPELFKPGVIPLPAQSIQRDVFSL
jgi:hypothetical protein